MLLAYGLLLLRDGPMRADALDTACEDFLYKEVTPPTGPGRLAGSYCDRRCAALTRAASLRQPLFCACCSSCSLPLLPRAAARRHSPQFDQQVDFDLDAALPRLLSWRLVSVNEQARTRAGEGDA